jgi:hypothetical protein
MELLSVRDLPRGVDLERDARLDLLYGSICFGMELFKPAPEGGTLMGRRITTLGYDGSVIEEKDVYNVRLFFDGASQTSGGRPVATLSQRVRVWWRIKGCAHTP